MTSNLKPRLMASTYAYVRFSSDRQKDGDSTLRQRTAAQTEADKRSLVIDEWIHDEGRSAFKGANRLVGNLSLWMGRLAAGEIAPGSVLIIESVDRLSREKVMDALNPFLLIVNSGVTIITTMDGQEYNRANLDDQWTKLILVLAKMEVAHDESEKKSVRSKSQWQSRRSKPDEKKMVAFLPGWLADVRTPIEERVKLINRMAFECVELNYGTGKIARRLNEDGIDSWGPTRKNGKRPTWHNNSVLNILRGRAVLGEHQPMRQDDDGVSIRAGPVELDYYPPVMETSRWAEIQRVLDKRSFKGSRGRLGQDYTNLFTKLATCAHCGAAYHRATSCGQHAYLRCSASARGTCKNTKGIPYQAFEDKFLSLVLATKFKGGRVDDASAISRLSTAQHAREALGRRIESIAEELVERKSPALGKMLDRAEAQMADVEVEVAAAQAALDAIHSTPAPHASQNALALELDKLKEPDADRYAIRSRIARAIKDVTTSLTFDDTRTAHIVLEDGQSVYEFDVRDGFTHRSEIITKTGSTMKIEGGVVTTLEQARAFKAALAA